jgi:hypothetical protein
MSQIATVEMIYVAHSGRQYRAQHKQVHIGWELEDLEQQAKSAMSLRDYAIEFVNVNGHKQFIMPVDLETIIVNVVAITEERWEEPDYERLQQKWNESVKPYDETDSETTQEAPAPPNPDRVREVGAALMHVKKQPRRNPVQPVAPDNETTQSVRITWPTQDAPVPQQRVSWPDMDIEETQPMSVLKSDEVAGMSLDDATAVIERVAAGGAVKPGS